MTRLFLLILLSALTLLTACSPNGVKGLVSASGIVSYGGKPISGVIIILTPLHGSASDYIGTAVSKEDGSFDLRTLEQMGVQPGEYKVSFSKTTRTTTAGTGNQDPNAMDYAPPTITEKQELPRKYLSPETSGISVTVSSGGNKSIRFELEQSSIEPESQKLPAI